MAYYIAQATRKKGIAFRKLPYSRKAGTAYHWTYVIRATDPKARKAIVADAKAAVKSGKIRYSNEAATNAKLYEDTKKHKFDCSKLKKKSSTNCINYASVCCRFAGLKTPRKSSAASMVRTWKDVRGLKIIRYRHGKTKLRAGDLLDASQKPSCHVAIYIGKRGKKKK